MSHEPRKFRNLLKSMLDKKVELETTDGEYVGWLKDVYKNYVKFEEAPIPPYQPGGYVYIRIRYILAARALS